MKAIKRYYIIGCLLLLGINAFSGNVFSVSGNKTYLNGEEFLAIGLRCSNALLSDETVSNLIDHLDIYKKYGLNTISVYYMGSRYSNIAGYNQDGILNPIFQLRMGRLIEACDKRRMVVLVGILYWGSGVNTNNNEFYSKWTQKEVNIAMRNTVRWLTDNHYQNVFIDPDNEGMAERGAKFNIAEMISEGKKINPVIPIAYNGTAIPPSCADLTIHFGKKLTEKPYIQTEGTPNEYWGEYSKEKNASSYINVGVYTSGKIEQQIKETKKLIEEGNGYLFASTWLQNNPPNYAPGGDGSPCNPGIRWWLEYIKNKYGVENGKI